MNDGNILALMQEIDAGRLSRNRHFDAYKQPEVREAKRRQQRVRALAGIFARAEQESWRISLQPERSKQGLWKLSCHSTRWCFRWSAYLKDFEMKLLWELPRVRPYLARLLPEEEGV